MVALLQKRLAPDELIRMASLLMVLGVARLAILLNAPSAPHEEPSRASYH